MKAEAAVFVLQRRQGQKCVYFCLAFSPNTVTIARTSHPMQRTFFFFAFVFFVVDFVSLHFPCTDRKRQQLHCVSHNLLVFVQRISHLRARVQIRELFESTLVYLKRKNLNDYNTAATSQFA